MSEIDGKTFTTPSRRQRVVRVGATILTTAALAATTAGDASAAAASSTDRGAALAATSLNLWGAQTGKATGGMSYAQATSILTAYTAPSTSSSVPEAKVLTAIQVASGAKPSAGIESATAWPAIGIRLAVKAALQVIKSRSVAMYNTIISRAYAGRDAFVSWYNNSAPAWVKVVLPGVAVNAIYDAILWVLGIG